MIGLVVDASLALKGFIGGQLGEFDVDAAMALLRAEVGQGVALIQPPYLEAEVAAVLIRETPATARRELSDLLDLTARLDATP